MLLALKSPYYLSRYLLYVSELHVPEPVLQGQKSKLTCSHIETDARSDQRLIFVLCNGLFCIVIEYSLVVNCNYTRVLKLLMSILVFGSG